MGDFSDTVGVERETQLFTPVTPTPSKSKKIFVIIGLTLGLIVLVLLIGEFVVIEKEKRIIEEEQQAIDNVTSTNWNLISKVLHSAMNRSVDPCVDFYEYACGGWMSTNSIPSDRVSWEKSFTVIDQQNEKILNDTLASHWPLLGTMYDNCLDLNTIDSLGHQPIEQWLSEIDKLSSITEEEYRESISTLLANMHTSGIYVLFEFYVDSDLFEPSEVLVNIDQGGLTLPSPEYYKDDRFSDDRESLRNYVEALMTLVNFTGSSEPEHVLDFETSLANFSRTNEERRDPYSLVNSVTIQTLQQTAPEIHWNKYFQTLGIEVEKLYDLNVVELTFFNNMSSLLTYQNREKFISYLRFRVIASTARYLSNDFRSQWFNFRSALYGIKTSPPRWRVCVDDVSLYMGDLLARYFILTQFSSTERDIAKNIIDNVEKAFKQNIQKSDWMDDLTKSRAVEKLEAITNKVGYPDEITDYSSIFLKSGRYYDNIVIVTKAAWQREIEKIGKPVDKHQWLMNAYEVNAYYNPPLNEIVIPAGILRGSFFSQHYPKAMNYGGIGSIIGHELTHGFDDEGSQFDSNGKLSQWWTAQSRKTFEQKATCVSDLYASYRVENDLHINGILTLGENLADMGGIKQAYDALKQDLELDKTKYESDHYIESHFQLNNDQLFFVSYAQNWCSLERPEFLEYLVTTNPHSPPKFRVLGPLSNFEQFHKAFSCSPGTPMNPEKKCTVW
eukprot:TRINITY_DN8025_c0_g1_i1.p1 TRINITY_DN8025_c0_g1~~TRINITY_DN8025_c0_g1_i1.p1  ORF type:complete len:747 (-),score=136.40 TRINITY_DN8025_c0_g1_i1:95-2275(-)